MTMNTRGSSLLAAGFLFMLVTACGGGGAGQATGTTALVLKDGPIQVVGEDRTVISVWIDIRRIELDRDGGFHDDETDEIEGLDDDQEDAREDEDDIVVFDVARGDNGGVPLHIDLLALTSTGDLLATLPVPVGVYDEAEIELAGASAEFADAPGVLVPLVLGGDDDGDDEFEFEFEPPLVVTSAGLSIAVIDFVPVVTRLGADYLLTQDGDADESGEAMDAEVETEGVVASVSADHNTITLVGVAFAIDVSTALVESDDLPDSKDSLAPGQTVDIEGMLDAASGVLVASDVGIR